MTVDEFLRCAAETVAWCNARANLQDPAGCLRSPALDPGACFEWRFNATPLEVFALREADARRVTALAARRRSLLVAAATDANASAETAGGRWMFTRPMETLSSEAMFEASQGFFERAEDQPPWDTWAVYVHEPQAAFLARYETGYTWPDEMLLFWVPEPFIALAESGMTNSEVGATQWLRPDLSLREVARQLSQDGWLEPSDSG